jgi:hypothetical protein
MEGKVEINVTWVFSLVVVRVYGDHRCYSIFLSFTMFLKVFLFITLN